MAYRESAPYYDLFIDENDVDYYKALALQHGSALEIGVSTTRVASSWQKQAYKSGASTTPLTCLERRKRNSQNSPKLSGNALIFSRPI